MGVLALGLKSYRVPRGYRMHAVHVGQALLLLALHAELAYRRMLPYCALGMSVEGSRELSLRFSVRILDFNRCLASKLKSTRIFYSRRMP